MKNKEAITVLKHIRETANIDDTAYDLVIEALEERMEYNKNMILVMLMFFSVLLGWVLGVLA